MALNGRQMLPVSFPHHHHGQAGRGGCASTTSLGVPREGLGSRLIAAARQRGRIPKNPWHGSATCWAGLIWMETDWVLEYDAMTQYDWLVVSCCTVCSWLFYSSSCSTNWEMGWTREANTNQKCHFRHRIFGALQNLLAHGYVFPYKGSLFLVLKLSHPVFCPRRFWSVAGCASFAVLTCSPANHRSQSY